MGAQARGAAGEEAGLGALSRLLRLQALGAWEFQDGSGLWRWGILDWGQKGVWSPQSGP